MKGHIRKRGNRWSVVVDAGVHPETGRRRQTWSRVRTKRPAERLLVEALAVSFGHSEVRSPAPRQNSLPSESRRMMLRYRVAISGGNSSSQAMVAPRA